MPKRVIKGTTESHNKLRETHGCQKHSLYDFFESKEKREKRELKEFVENLRIFEIDPFDPKEVCEYCDIVECKRKKKECPVILNAKVEHRLRDFYWFEPQEKNELIYFDCLQLSAITTIKNFFPLNNRTKIYSLDELFYIKDDETWDEPDRYIGHKSFPGNWFRYTLIRGFLKHSEEFEVFINYDDCLTHIHLELCINKKFWIHIAARIREYNNMRSKKWLD